jgi:hypothetical protein
MATVDWFVSQILSEIERESQKTLAKNISLLSTLRKELLIIQGMADILPETQKLLLASMQALEEKLKTN